MIGEPIAVARNARVVMTKSSPLIDKWFTKRCILRCFAKDGWSLNKRGYPSVILSFIGHRKRGKMRSQFKLHGTRQVSNE